MYFYLNMENETATGKFKTVNQSTSEFVTEITEVEYNEIKLPAKKINGDWVVDTEYESPPEDPEIAKQQRIAEIDAELTTIDMESIRPLRAIADGVDTEQDRAYLDYLEQKATELRTERGTLSQSAQRINL